VSVFNWSEIPDLVAIALLTAAFASVSRRNPTRVSGIWLTGWIMITLHFAAFLFLYLPGFGGKLAAFVGLSALVWAGLLFMWSSVPYRKKISSRCLFATVGATNTVYIALVTLSPNADRALIPAATLIGALPLVVALLAMRNANSPLRWVLVGLYSTLASFLLLTQFKSGDGGSLALNGVLFTVYFGCCIHFWYQYRRATAGSFITVAGFLAWAGVSAVEPWMQAFLPNVHVESEVWSLPKYVVAVGMILLLLEDQIEHNRHLALHDHLTGLPNRRLYQDRLAIALERARRSQAQAALLVVDLDRFKEVNDTMGHHVGDLVLRHVAAMFAARVRRSDTVARTGGDEFSIILEQPTSREDAIRVRKALERILDEPIQLAEKEVRVGASIGIAIFPDDASEMEDLCIAADLRMYDVKKSSAIDSREIAPAEPYLLTALKHDSASA
jgi:diguanylate cyclase (GGDEF)-like protein